MKTDLSIDPLEVKAEMLREADDRRERIFAGAREAYEEQSASILRNLNQAQILEVHRRAFGNKFDAFTGGGES